MSDHEPQPLPVDPPLADSTDSAERYERGLTLRKAGLFRQAIEQLEQAADDPLYALKAHAQIGLCHKALRQYERASTAFRDALKAPAASTKETVQVLYALGRTLETMGHTAEALDVYRWLRREDQQFRDVAARIESLSTRRTHAEPPRTSWLGWRSRQAAAWRGPLRSIK